MKSTKTGRKKRYLLFLPEGEWHELGLLFYTWLILKNGHKALYLGQSTPLESVLSAANIWKPDFVVTGTLTGLPMEDPTSYLEKLHSSLRVKKIFIAGTLAAHSEKLKLPGIIPLINDYSVLFTKPKK
jgi:methanogenic corrinoid protein MtbC1